MQTIRMVRFNDRIIGVLSHISPFGSNNSKWFIVFLLLSDTPIRVLLVRKKTSTAFGLQPVVFIMLPES